MYVRPSDLVQVLGNSRSSQSRINQAPRDRVERIFDIDGDEYTQLPLLYWAAMRFVGNAEHVLNCVHCGFGPSEPVLCFAIAPALVMWLSSLLSNTLSKTLLNPSNRLMGR